VTFAPSTCRANTVSAWSSGLPFARAISVRAVSLSILARGLALCAGALPSWADEPVKVSITLKDHKFSPAEPTAPAGKPIVLEVSNQDGTPAEFESKVFRVEKVIVGGGTVTINLRPLKPGRYRFFDDYHEATTEGFLVVP
jgi:Cupredoxin-like domain